MNYLLRDLRGQTFGNLTVLEVAEKHASTHTVYFVFCILCGNVKPVIGSYLTRKVRPYRHCGCQTKNINVTHSHCRGYRYSPEYRSWAAMKSRCTNPKQSNFKWYGGAGVKVCKQWRTFEGFLKSAGIRPSLAHTMGRVADTGNYDPKLGTRWMTRVEHEIERVKKLAA